MNLTLPRWLKKIGASAGSAARGPVLGIDPGSWSVKAVMADSVFEITQCLERVRSADSAEQMMKLSIETAGLKDTRAAFSLADEKIESHEFHLPKLPKKEIDTAVEWEVKKLINAPDYHFHDVLAYETGDGFDVQCVVAAKDIVKNKWEDALHMGVKPSFLETESSALLACVTALKGGELVDRTAVIDLGYSTFRLIFLHAGRVSFTRSLYFGLATLSHQVATQIGGVPTEIQALLRNLQPGVAVDPANAALAAAERNFQELLYTLCEEFRRSEFFVRDQKAREDVGEVLLCGGGACLPFAVDYLARHLSEKRVEVLNPFASAKKLPEGFDVTSGPLWACALGLALRG